MVQVVLFDKEKIDLLVNIIRANEGKVIKIQSQLFEIPKNNNDVELKLEFTPIVYDDEYGFNRDICNDIYFEELIEIIEVNTSFEILEQVDALHMVYRDIVDTSNAKILKLHQEFAERYSVEFSQTPLSKFDLIEIREKHLNSDKIKELSNDKKLIAYIVRGFVSDVMSSYIEIDAIVNHYYKELGYVGIDR